jgi:hypothetical protein
VGLEIGEYGMNVTYQQKHLASSDYCDFVNILFDFLVNTEN